MEILRRKCKICQNLSFVSFELTEKIPVKEFPIYLTVRNPVSLWKEALDCELVRIYVQFCLDINLGPSLLVISVFNVQKKTISFFLIVRRFEDSYFSSSKLIVKTEAITYMTDLIKKESTHVSNRAYFFFLYMKREM